MRCLSYVVVARRVQSGGREGGDRAEAAGQRGKKRVTCCFVFQITVNFVCNTKLDLRANALCCPFVITIYHASLKRA